MEDLLEFLDAAANWASIPLGLAIALTVAVTAGWWRPRRLALAWLVGLALVGVSLYLGVARGEWGETLFNGQLL